jgi:hypothetical protein
VVPDLELEAGELLAIKILRQLRKIVDDCRGGGIE